MIEIFCAVVPTVVIPFAVVSLVCSSIATFIAGLFGMELKWEGPKRLLEVLLKPKVIVSSILLSGILMAGHYGYVWLKNTPSFLWTVRYKNLKFKKSYELVNTTYTDWTERYNQFPGPQSEIPPLKSIEQKWNVKLEKGIFGAATLSGNSVFVGSDDGIVYELAQDDGHTRRQFYVGTEITPQPIIWKQKMFVGEGIHTTHGARIYSFDLITGDFVGAFQTKGHTEGGPVVASYSGKTLLFVMAGSDGIYALDPQTLTPIWHQTGLGHIDSEVRVKDQYVYVSTGIEKGSEDRTHRAYALEFFSGRILWQTELPASAWMPPILTDTDVCFVVGEIYASSDFGQFACYDLRHGIPRLSVNLDAPLMGVPLEVGHSVYLTDIQGQVCAVKWPQAWRSWCLPTHQKSYASAAYDRVGYILYPSANDGLYVLNLETGMTIQKWSPSPSEGSWGKSFSSVSVSPSKGWFLTDMDGNVRRLMPNY